MQDVFRQVKGLAANRINKSKTHKAVASCIRTTVNDLALLSVGNFELTASCPSAYLRILIEQEKFLQSHTPNG